MKASSSQDANIVSATGADSTHSIPVKCDYTLLSDISSAPSSDERTIYSIEVRNDSLVFYFGGFGGGAGYSEYKLYVSKSKEKTNSAIVYLYRDGKNEVGKALVMRRYTAFDLTGLKKDLGMSATLTLELPSNEKTGPLPSLPVNVDDAPSTEMGAHSATY